MEDTKVATRNERIRARRRRGWTLRAIARQFKLSHTQVANICKDNGHAA